MEPAEMMRAIEEINLSAKEEKTEKKRATSQTVNLDEKRNGRKVHSADRAEKYARTGKKAQAAVQEEGYTKIRKKVQTAAQEERYTKTGKKVQTAAHTEKKAGAKVVRYKRKHRTKLLIPAAVVLVAGIGAGVGYYLWYQSFTEISLAKQTSVVMSGYNGKGSAELSLEPVPEFMDFFNQVEVTLTKDSHLSNGDTVEISYSFDEKLARQMKLRVDGEPEMVTIEGLAIPTQVTEEQLFEAVKVSTEDLSPMIQVSVENVSEDAFLQSIPFEILESKAYYENGDSITVRATIDEEAALLHAYAFEGDRTVYEKTYPISSEESYLTNPAELSEDQLSTLISNGAKYFDAAHAKEYGLRLFSEAHLMPQWENKQTFFSWVNPRMISAYFNVVSEEGKELLETHVNDVKVVYEATLTQPDGKACNAEVVVQYTDLKKLADGTVDLSLDSGKIIGASIRNSNIKNMVYDTGDGNYISTKLK